MALIACPVCGKLVSNLAPVCPGCGHPLRPPRRPATGLWLGCGCLVTAFLTFLLMTIIGLLVWVGISLQPAGEEENAPDAATVTAENQRDKCAANLEEIALIKEEWATAHNARKGDIIPEADLDTIFNGKKKDLICPKDEDHSLQTSYEIGPIGTAPRCKCDEEHNEPDPDTK